MTEMKNVRKNFYLVQIGVSYSSPVFLPYSVGCIAAYLKADRDITNRYDICDIVFRREPIDTALGHFDSPFAVAFSCFAWNMQYNLQLAKKVKEKFPDCLIVFGGHSVPPDASLLAEYGFIDFLMHGEGEESTAALLKVLDNGGKLDSVAGLSYRGENGLVTVPGAPPADISGYPSPYTAGIFDGMLEKYPEIEFHATLETNRGCPYDCSYCEWCFTKKLREFPMSKIKAEIDWIASHKIAYCYCADANFGILRRDVEIAEYIIGQREKHGYPKIFKPCYAKESDDTVFRAGCLLNQAGADKGVTLAYQTLSETALKNIGRKNLTLEHFSKLDARYNSAGIPTYTELILGLPGETLESFCRGMCRLLESGQHNSMTVYECQVYANSVMGDAEYQKKHGIVTSRIPLLGIHYNPDFSGVNEYFDIITQTDTMSRGDWVKACMFAVILQAFHHLGLARCFAIYMRYEKDMPYFDFYNRLFTYIFEGSNGFLHRLYSGLLARKADVEAADWTYQRDEFGTTGWYFEEGAFLESVCAFDDFFDDLMPFLKGLGVEPEVFGELLKYQTGIIRRPGVNSIVLDCGYDFYNYFERIYQNAYAPLEKKHCTLRIRAKKDISSMAEYAREAIWFGKRRGATLMTNPREHIEQI